MSRGPLPSRPLSSEEFERYEDYIHEFETVEQYNSYIAAVKASETAEFADEERAIRKAAGAIVLVFFAAKGLEEFFGGL